MFGHELWGLLHAPSRGCEGKVSGIRLSILAQGMFGSEAIRVSKVRPSSRHVAAVT